MLKSAGEREKSIMGSVTSGLIKANQEVGSRSHASHEERTAADFRQNVIYDVVITQIVHRYEGVRLLRLEPRTPSEYHHIDASYAL